MSKKLPIYEFIAMLAMLFALIAFSTDGMLPAFPSMTADLTPDQPNRIQLVVATFMFGLGIGTFVTGPLSDAYGRKSVVVGGVLLFIFGCLISYFAQSLEVLLLGRVLQGFGAAGPRIGPLAMMRDLYEGRKMAQLMSIIMAVFMLFPAVAPAIGQQIIAFGSWRLIFVSFAIFAGISSLWFMIRQPETLPPEKRRPLKIGPLLEAAKEVVTNPMVVLFTLALTLGFTQLLSVISSIQQVYEFQFGIVDAFPLWFALGALIAASGTLVNASLVLRLGMRKLAITAFAAQIILAFTMIWIVRFPGLEQDTQFWLWFFWSTSNFFMAGLIFGNLNALALQPLGHIAGTAASIITGLSTVGAAILSIPIGAAFNGTSMPLMLGNGIAALIAFLALRKTVDAPAA